jgi:hypothetical protein
MRNKGKTAADSVLCLAICFGLTGFAVPATASDVDGPCSGAIGLSVGQWASYATDAPLMRDKVKSRHAIVGSEESHYWMEFEAATPTGQGAFVIKILIPGWPFTVEDIKRALMQLPRVEGMEPIPPMEMPPQNIQKDNLSEPLQMACDEKDKGVPESVTVPAGTFSAMRIPVRKLGKDVWLSSNVPFGIVKMADAEGNGMEVIAFGSDAEPAITEMPQQIPGMEQQ